MSRSDLEETKHVIIYTPAVAKRGEIIFRDSEQLLPWPFTYLAAYLLTPYVGTGSEYCFMTASYPLQPSLPHSFLELPLVLMQSDQKINKG